MITEPSIAKRLIQTINQQLPSLYVHWNDNRLYVDCDDNTLITIYFTKQSNLYQLDSVDFSTGWQNADPTTCDCNELPTIIKLLQICHQTK